MLIVHCSTLANTMEKFLKRKKNEMHETDESSGDSHSSKEKQRRKPAPKLRKYIEDYIKYGFVESASDPGKPQCLICNRILSNEALKPAKLERHMKKQHPDLAGKPKCFFQRKKEEYLKQTASFKSSMIPNEKLLKASYLVALRVARAKKAHTIAENLILPSAMDMCETILGKESASKLKSIPLSDNTIARRIADMSDDIKTQLIDRLKQGCFAIQLDESTDIASQSQLLVYVRYCWEGEMIEDFLFCYAMPSRTTGEEVFKALDKFFSQSGLSWDCCIGICTDGAASMTGKHSGVVARVKQVMPDIRATHCMIHRESLASKNIGQPLSEVLSACITIINFIKSRPLSTRIFASLCEEMGAEHSNLLLHTEVRWLSRGKVIRRLFELREELLVFLTEYNADLASFIVDEIWLGKLAYLADIFNLINELNLSLQGRDSNILKTHDKIAAFKKKLSLWKARISTRILDMFPTLSDYICNNSSIDVDLIICDVGNHLDALSHHFDEYFTNDNIMNFDWIRNPFDVEMSDLAGRELEELAELSCDRSLKIQFQQKSLSSFWLSVSAEYHLLSNKAVKILLPFATTYLCETAFSALTNMKTKYRSRLVAEGDMRVCLSNITPRIDSLCKAKQAHPSH